MTKLSKEMKTELIKDVSVAIDNFANEAYGALTKTLIKLCPEKTKEIKAYVQWHKAGTVAKLKKNIIGEESDVEATIEMNLSIINEFEIRK